MQNGGSSFHGFITALVLLSLLPLCGCGRKSGNEKQAVIRTVTLDTLSIINEEVRIQDIHVDDCHIVLLTSGNPMLYILDKNTGDVMKRTCFVGHASNEYLMTPHSINVRNHQAQFMDRSRKQMCYISLLDFGQKRRDVPYTANFRPARAVDVDGSLVCVGSFSQGRIGFVKTDNTMEVPDYDYPYDTGDVEGIYRGSLYQSEILVPECGNQCFVYSLASDSFEIYKCMSGVLEKVYASPVNYAPVVNKSGSRHMVDYNRSKAGIIHASVTDSSIFCMFSTMSYNEAARSGFKGDRITEFGWDGSRKAEYCLPVMSSSFCVDDEFFYVVCEGHDESVVIRVHRERG